jgi:hypothetical protein
MNSESPRKDGYTDEEEMEYGDHLLHTISGTTTTVPKSFVKASAMVKVEEPKPETHITEKTSTLKLDTEDAQVAIPRFLTAESTVDQTTMTRAPKLMSNVQENHGYHQLESKVQNSELLDLLPVGSTEREVTTDGDH